MYSKATKPTRLIWLSVFICPSVQVEKGNDRIKSLLLSFSVSIFQVSLALVYMTDLYENIVFSNTSEKNSILK